MPKLDKKKAERVNDVEPSDFAPLPEGMYLATLLEVKVSEKPGPSGDHYWIWEFGELSSYDEDETPFPGKQWSNVSVGESSEWKMKEHFDAFGVPAETDTDELVGEKCILVVVQRVIEKGARMGQVGNNIQNILPLNFEEALEEAAAAEKAEPEPEPAPKGRARR